MAIVIGEWDLQPAPAAPAAVAAPTPGGQPAARPVKPHHIELALHQLAARGARVRAH